MRTRQNKLSYEVNKRQEANKSDKEVKDQERKDRIMNEEEISCQINRNSKTWNELRSNYYHSADVSIPHFTCGYG